jgi:hypothetical protein
MNIGLYFKIALAFVFLGLMTYTFYLRSEVNTLEKDNLVLVQANEANQNYIKALKTEFDKVTASQNTINKILREKDAKVIELNNKLTRLETLAQKKPTLIEKRVNDGTKKVFKNIEEISKND